MTGRRTGSALLLTLSASQFWWCWTSQSSTSPCPRSRTACTSPLPPCNGWSARTRSPSKDCYCSAAVSPTRPAGPGCSGLALADAAFAVAHGSLAALLGTLVLQGIAGRLNQVSSNIAGTHGPVAARTAAPPRAAAATPVPPPCRRNPVTTATRGQGAREIVFACPAVLRSTGAPRTADQGSGPGAVTGATRSLARDADACTNPGD